MKRWAVLPLLLSVLMLSGCGAKTTTTTKTTTTKKTPPAGAPVPQATVPEGAIKLTGENTKITFIGTKADGKHNGGFKEVSGYILPKAEAKNPIHVEIDTASLFSDDKKLTGHLKSSDFFDVNKHPKAIFEAKKLDANKDGDNTHLVTGTLTMLGETKEVSFPAKMTMSDDKVTLKATFPIDRTKWGMKYGQGKVNNEVTISVSIDAKK